MPMNAPVVLVSRGVERSMAVVEITVTTDLPVVEVDWRLRQLDDGRATRFEQVLPWQNQEQLRHRPIVKGVVYVTRMGVVDGTRIEVAIVSVLFGDGSVWRSGRREWPARSSAVAVRAPGGDRFDIDRRFVTRAQYLDWLASRPSLAEQPPACAWNRSYAQDRPCLDVFVDCAGGDCPIGCVDWCDARAYCDAVGRRLCGAIGGGATPFREFSDPDRSQWEAACESRSVDLRQTSWTWEDSCDGAAGATNQCRTRTFTIGMPGAPNSQAINCGAANTYLRSQAFSHVGFRCCE